MATSGLYTTDNVPTSQLYTELIRDIGLYNQADPLFMERFCVRTTKKTVRVAQQAGRFKKSGSDMAHPQWDRNLYREITLGEPEKYQLAEGYTREALERGMDSSEIRDLNADAVSADGRLLQEIVLKAMLNDGGFWDATMSLAPPSYKSNTFATSHDHYLASNASGIPTLAFITDMQTHIVEHGYGLNGGLIVLINSVQSEAITNKAEWNTTSNYVSTPVIAQLQAAGIINGPTFNAAGIPVSVNDWVPSGYMLMVDVNARLCHWRDTEGVGGRNLIIEVDEDFVKNITEYRRYVSCTVTQKSAGCVYYLGSGTWTDYTGWTV
jgi:hypothetical protein